MPTPRCAASALVGIIFGSVVLHELGHALVARGSGIPAKGIILLPIGGITILDEAHAIPDPVNALEARHPHCGCRTAGESLHRRLIRADSARRRARLFAHREAAASFERPVAEHRLGEPLSRIV